MSGLRVCVGAALLSAALGVAAQEEIPARVMNVTQGPETVFGKPATEILPALMGATATGENGRVGRELVFWGYRQADGRVVFFFACAPDVAVDCMARVPTICLNRTTVLETGEASGNVVRRVCRNVAVATPGDRRPGCVDRVESTPMAVGLVTCG